MIVGFTGTKRGMTVEQRIEVGGILARLPARFEARHGDCVGADLQFHFLCIGQARRCASVTIHPPTDDKLRAFAASYASEGVEVKVMPAKSYLKRNADIVDGAALLIATPSSANARLRSGTWATVRHAWASDIETLIVLPTGATVARV